MHDHKRETSQGNILIIDDSLENLRLLHKLLTDAGYDIRPTSNGRMGLLTAQRELPDLVLLDIRMPEMDGYEVCKALKANERTQDIPVIFISALHEADDKIKAFSLGGVDYVTKPFQESEILARVRTHLGIRELQRDLRKEIAERKRAEQDALKNEEMAKALLNASADAVALLDDRGMILDLNNAHAQRFHKTRDEMLGTCVWDLFPPEVTERRKMNVNKVFETGKPVVMEDEREGMWNHTNIYPISDFSGEVTRVAVFARDITKQRMTEKALGERTKELERNNRDLEREIKERRQSEKALRIERERFFSTLEKIPAFVHLQAPDHSIRYANMKFRNLFGDPGGRRCYEVIPGRDRPCEPCPTFEVFKTKKTKVWKWQCDDDKTYMIHDSHLADTDGSPLVLKMGVDVTASRQIEKTLHERTRELERSNRDLEQFAYVVSHDLSEPLRMVSSYVRLLERRYKGQLDADADDFIGFAAEGAARMHGLINDMLAFSRVGTRGKPFGPVETAHVLEQALANLSVSIRESRARITHDALPRVIADGSQLTQVFQNLISNAMKFRGEGRPRIHIAAKKKEGEWAFSFRDNGIGISEEYAERIFVIFQRLHTRKKYPGTGVGLAICKKIVERHGGRIWASREDAGSVFCFTLPDKEEN